MQKLQVIEQYGIRVLTTRQLAKEYQAEEWKIKQNFRNNKNRFLLGKHYITLQGNELRKFKDKVENIYLVGKTAKVLYLWTEKGALLHAKSLNTDKAWEVYDYLVDFYFRAKENTTTLMVTEESVPPVRLTALEEKIIAYNRGVVLGVYKSEMARKGVDALTIYNQLSSQGKEMVASLLFGEV